MTTSQTKNVLFLHLCTWCMFLYNNEYQGVCMKKVVPCATYYTMVARVLLVEGVNRIIIHSVEECFRGFHIVFCTFFSVAHAQYALPWDLLAILVVVVVVVGGGGGGHTGYTLNPVSGWHGTVRGHIQTSVPVHSWIMNHVSEEVLQCGVYIEPL